MDRASLFVVIISVFFMMLFIYEKISIGPITGGFDSKIEDQAPIVNITGIMLPPIKVHKDMLYTSLSNQLIGQVNKRKDMTNNDVTAIIKAFRKFYDKAYIRWIFESNARHELRDDLIPLKDPISQHELEYFFKEQSDAADLTNIHLKYEIAREVSRLRANIPIKTRILSAQEQESWPKSAGISDWEMIGYKRATSNGLAIMINENNVRGGPKFFPITHIQARRLRELWDAVPIHAPGSSLLGAAWTLLYVYHTLGGLGNNGSVPRGIIDNTFTELFGSPMNTQQAYCSPFKFEQDIFGSLGSFFDYKLIPGQKYTFNPPYVADFMNMSAERLVSQLEQVSGSKESTTVVCVIPVWDSATQLEIGDPDGHEDFPAFDTLKNSKFFIGRKVLKKEEHKFYSWYDNEWISYASTHLIVLSTGETQIDIDEFEHKWLNLTSQPCEHVPNPQEIVIKELTK